MEPPSPTDDAVRIESPEHVALDFELAGGPTRILAGLIDLGLQAGAIAFVVLAGVLWSGASFSIHRDLGAAGLALVVLAVFAIFWGYPILMEALCGGRTLGKMAAGIRVIKEGGYPITWSDAVVRNLLRFADFLPAGYALGVLMILLHPRYQRLGDLAARTIVVRERREHTAPPRTHARAYAVDEEVVADLRRRAVHTLPAEALRMIEGFLDRRHGLDPAARTHLAQTLAEPLRGRLGDPALPAERFLEHVWTAYRRGTSPEGA